MPEKVGREMALVNLTGGIDAARSRMLDGGARILPVP